MLRSVLPSALVVACLAAPGMAQVKLELKHPEGSKATYKKTTKLHQVLTINGMEIPTDTDSVATTTEEVGKRTAEGKLPITETTAALKAQIDLPGGMNVTFDSANPDADKPDNPALASLQGIFKALVGTSYTVVLDKDGKVAAIEGAEKVLDKAGDLDPMVLEQLKARFSAEKLKKEREQEHNVFPDILVRTGEPWERTEVMDIGGGQTFTFKKRYEYQGTTEQGGKALDKISAKNTDVTYAMEANAANPAKVNKSDLKIASSDGEILFDRQAGKVVKRQTKTRITGDMTLEINGMEFPTKLDLTIETKTELQPADSK
jgi:hypothetical protein